MTFHCSIESETELDVFFPVSAVSLGTPNRFYQLLKEARIGRRSTFLLPVISGSIFPSQRITSGYVWSNVSMIFVLNYVLAFFLARRIVLREIGSEAGLQLRAADNGIISRTASMSVILLRSRVL